MPVINTYVPGTDEIEVSIFGPGVGECIVFHAGMEEWFIVDSCLNPDTRQPIALEYLQQLGVDYKTKVKGIFITHFHSDHVMGIAKLIEECRSADLYFSHALAKEPAFTLAILHMKNGTAIKTPLSKPFVEFSNCIKTLEAQGRRPERVNAGRTIFNKTAPFVRKLICLSPSNASVEMANANLMTYLDPTLKLMRGVSQCISENLNAIAIHLSLGDVSVLLGSDLEEQHGNAEVGWSAVISGGYYESNELGKSHIFKVPHHGSITGHHDHVWSDLLNTKPLSVLTTYSSSDLPRDTDIKRIKGHSNALYSTTLPKAAKNNRSAAVQRQIKRSTKSIRSIPAPKMGHIQVRAKCPASIVVATNENAEKC